MEVKCQTMRLQKISFWNNYFHRWGTHGLKQRHIIWKLIPNRSNNKHDLKLGFSEIEIRWRREGKNFINLDHREEPAKRGESNMKRSESTLKQHSCEITVSCE